jgi:hypothetical protein
MSLKGSQESSVELADILGPLDTPIRLTTFRAATDTEPHPGNMSLRTLADLIRRTAVTEAVAAGTRHPLVKLATFNGPRSSETVELVTGVETDHDAGEIGPEEAVARLRKAGVAGLIYTSRRHTPEWPRWRALLPLAAPVAPEEREALARRAAAILGVSVDPASFAVAQAFYYAGVEGRERVAELVDGGFLDRVRTVADDLADLIGEEEEPRPAKAADTAPRGEADPETVRAALAAIPADRREDWLKVGMALRHEFGDDGRELWNAWSAESDKFDAKDQRRVWRSFKGRTGAPVTIGSLFKLAMDHGWEGSGDDVDGYIANLDDLEDREGDRPRLSFLSPADCEAAPSRGYIVKGILAPRDVACIFGAPGAGKSLLAPFVGYSVARGEEAFGMRAKPGSVLYVASEDSHGMRGRVRALKEAHGDAPDFTLVEGVSDLLSPAAPDLKALLAAVKERKPALIFIDTLAMAFPGLEENDAKGMGRVVAVARTLTEWGAAVVLIHHDTKAEGGTPRGHSVLNGALDVALHVKRGEGGIIRGTLTKNRNGTCERDIAFTIKTEDGGTDEDGDVIRLPRCNPLGPDGGFTLHLPPVERKALAVFREMLHVRELDAELADDEDMARIAGAVPEIEFREACTGQSVLSGSGNRESRARAFKRALEGLTGQGVLTRFVRPDTGQSYVGFNSASRLAGDEPKPGQSRTIRTCPTGESGGGPGQTRTLPLGVSGCPVRPSPRPIESGQQV